MLNIEKLRTEKGLSKNMLCKKSGISLKAYLAIINAGDVKLSTLKKNRQGFRSEGSGFV